MPKAHFLEAWGDARTRDGTITLAQPLIAPLYGGLSSIELCSLLLGNELGGEQLVQREHAARGIVDWRKNVHDGFVPNTALPAATEVALDGAGDAGAQGRASSPAPSAARTSSRWSFHMSSFTYDGRFANNAWLWETPDFLTKVTWDNYALISPETSTALDVANGDMITVKIGEHSVDLPAYTMPGQARYSIGLVLGGGRTEAGHVSQHPHNVDADVSGQARRRLGYLQGPHDRRLRLRDRRDGHEDRPHVRARRDPGSLELQPRPVEDDEVRRRLR